MAWIRRVALVIIGICSILPRTGIRLSAVLVLLIIQVCLTGSFLSAPQKLIDAWTLAMRLESVECTVILAVEWLVRSTAVYTVGSEAP